MGKLSFRKLCKMLATTHGGYTVWLGAGAAAAITGGAAPSWRGLVDRLAGGNPKPSNWDTLDYPARLDWISCRIGHAAFRRALRTEIIEPVLSGALHRAVIEQMAVIGLRAGAVVSFNIETVSSGPMSHARGGSIVPRTFRRPDIHKIFSLFTTGGLVAAPVFMPHGSLDLYGNCVITQSEYSHFKMSLGVETAVNLCLGGDLLILGMSLGDAYLRDAILKHRSWINEVFWVADDFEHYEWARVADVHCVEASRDEVWEGIANSILEHDQSGEVHRICTGESGILQRAVRGVGTMRSTIQSIKPSADKLVETLVGSDIYPKHEVLRFARAYEDYGFEIPEALRMDSRYLESWSVRGDPDRAQLTWTSDQERSSTEGS